MTSGVLKRFAPLFLYVTLVGCLFIAALATRGQSKTSILSLIGCGLLSWGLLEYGLHRFIFHLDAHSEFMRRFVYSVHLSHHDKPQETDRLFTSLRVSAPLAMIYFLLAWGFSSSWETAVYLFTGLVAGYLIYEWIHYQAHHGRPRISLFRYLKKYHLLHHHSTPDIRFGVTSPAFDYLFGTYRSASKR
ncbi:MAG TPA: sterol desaturase family protein [Pyrinomonadaceae bacterium]